MLEKLKILKKRKKFYEDEMKQKSEEERQKAIEEKKEELKQLREKYQNADHYVALLKILKHLGTESKFSKCLKMI